MEKLLSVLPFSYSVSVPALAAGEVHTGYFTIQPDSHFLARQRVMKTDESMNNNDFFIPNATVLITDMGSGRKFMREPIHLSNLFGRGCFPYKIPLGGKVFYKREIIEVRVENTSGALLPPMTLEWQGEKVFTTS